MSIEPVRNAAKVRLAADEIVLCVQLRHAQSVDWGIMAKACGFDAFYVDMEHGSSTLQNAAQICSSAVALGIAPLVRVQAGAYNDAARALDGGAMGVLFPHCDTAADAEKIVEACKFAPLGHRGSSGAGPVTGYRSMPLPELQAQVNEATMLIPMLESAEGVENAEAIAAVPGIDVLQIGTNDLLTSLGIPGQVDHPRLRECYVHVAQAVRKHGKHMGIGAVHGKPERTQDLIKVGARFVMAGNEASYFMNAARRDVQDLRKMQK